MLVKLAWKNIWRNPLRSMVVMSAIIIGIWALMFLLSFSFGMISSYINSSIESRTSHLQIHHPSFIDDPDVSFYLKDKDRYANTIAEVTDMNSVSPRLVVHGLISSASGSRGAIIKAVDPTKEAATTSLHKKVKEGEYLNKDRRNPIILSRGMAKRLGISLDQHVVISFQGGSTDFVSGRFRVSGYFDTGNTKVDDMMAWVRYDDLLAISEIPEDCFHEMAVLLNNISEVEPTQALLAHAFKDAEVRNYKEISPDLAIYNEQIKLMLIIIIAIIMIALMFGIINTMLMAVLERYKELGMLMAIGMNKTSLFLMIILESFFLCVAAAPLGIVLGHFTIQLLHKKGIDLSAWSDALEQYGLDAIIRPQLDIQIYFVTAFSLITTAILAGLYPALKAINTKPIEALRKI